MTTLSELLYEYVFDLKLNGDSVFNKWFNKFQYYEREVGKVKDGKYEPNDSEAWDEFVFDCFNEWDE